MATFVIPDVPENLANKYPEPEKHRAFLNHKGHWYELDFPRLCKDTTTLHREFVSDWLHIRLKDDLTVGGNAFDIWDEKSDSWCKAMDSFSNGIKKLTDDIKDIRFPDLTDLVIVITHCEQQLVKFSRLIPTLASDRKVLEEVLKMQDIHRKIKEIYLEMYHSISHQSPTLLETEVTSGQAKAAEARIQQTISKQPGEKKINENSASASDDVVAANSQSQAEPELQKTDKKAKKMKVLEALHLGIVKPVSERRYQKFLCNCHYDNFNEILNEDFGDLNEGNNCHEKWRQHMTVYQRHVDIFNTLSHCFNEEICDQPSSDEETTHDADADDDQ